MTNAELTFYAEELGDIDDVTRAADELCQLIKHESPLVREGAVYGLSKLMGRINVPLKTDAVLENIAANDPSPGVREAAREALEP